MRWVSPYSVYLPVFLIATMIDKGKVNIVHGITYYIILILSSIRRESW